MQEEEDIVKKLIVGESGFVLSVCPSAFLGRIGMHCEERNKSQLNVDS